MRILAALSIVLSTSVMAKPELIAPLDPQSDLAKAHSLGIEIGIDYLEAQRLTWGVKDVHILPPDFPLDEEAPELSVAGLSFWYAQDGVIGALPGLQALDAKFRQHFDDPLVLHNDVMQNQELAATIQPDNARRFTSVEDLAGSTGPVLVFWSGDLPNLAEIEADRLYVFGRFVNPTSLARLAKDSYQISDWYALLDRTDVSDYLVLESLKRSQAYPDTVVEAAFRSVLVARELSQDAAIANRAIETASGLLRYGPDLTPNTPLLLLQQADDGWQFVQRW